MAPAQSADFKQAQDVQIFVITLNRSSPPFRRRKASEILALDLLGDLRRSLQFAQLGQAGVLNGLRQLRHAAQEDAQRDQRRRMPDKLGAVNTVQDDIEKP